MAKKTIWDGDKRGLDKLLYYLYQGGLQQKAEDEDWANGIHLHIFWDGFLYLCKDSVPYAKKFNLSR